MNKPFVSETVQWAAGLDCPGTARSRLRHGAEADAAALAMATALAIREQVLRCHFISENPDTSGDRRTFAPTPAPTPSHPHRPASRQITADLAHVLPFRPRRNRSPGPRTGFLRKADVVSACEDGCEPEYARDVQISGSGEVPAGDRVLTPEAIAFVSIADHRFDPTRRELLRRRDKRQLELRAGKLPDFLSETQNVRTSAWKVAATPRRSAGPPRRDHRAGRPQDDDQRAQLGREGLHGRLRGRATRRPGRTSSTVSANLQRRRRAARITFDNRTARQYKLNERDRDAARAPARLALVEKHVLVDGEPVSGEPLRFRSVLLSQRAGIASRAAAGPYFYLPKMESHLEARLWNDVFVSAQDALGIPRGTIRATVLIETILAAFEMEEILYELREHSAGLNCGRWDYIFSFIKKFAQPPRLRVAGSRAGDDGPCRSCARTRELLVQTCHRRGAHAIGGMAAFIPEPTRCRGQRTRARQGARGQGARGERRASMAPGSRTRASLPSRSEVFDDVLGDSPNQKRRHARATCMSTRGRSARRARSTAGAITEGRRAERRRRRAVPRSVAAAARARADPQPDGRRGDRGDLARAALAVARARVLRSMIGRR